MLNDIRINAPRYVLPELPARPERHTAGVIVIGGGAAGLAAALRAAEETSVIVLTRGALPQSNSAWAQGGIAAALDRNDSPLLHIEDTLIAGAGLSDRAAVTALAEEAPPLMGDLAMLGVPFERENDHFALGLEGGHSRNRILHTGDATGWAITSTLIEQARQHPQIAIYEGFQAVDLLGEPGHCVGVLALDADGTWHVFAANATILASGGAGALYGLTSNQPTALGEGIALAYRAGAAVSDMEFVQFHPTVMRLRDGSGFLITEAARGEGGMLLTVDGDRFMLAEDARAELAPRDIVARGIFRAMQRTGSDHVLLDLTHLSSGFFARRFPTIYARCKEQGIDPTTTPLAVAPAAHYLMGGIRTDSHGATNIVGLYAAGECACTGIHGANRLASNSLLECLIFGRRAAEAAIRGQEAGSGKREAGSGKREAEGSVSRSSLVVRPLSEGWRSELAAVMRGRAGLQRDAEGLRAALSFLDTFVAQPRAANADTITVANATLTAKLIVAAALLREESRGAHFRTDFPQPDDAWRTHLVLANGDAPRATATMDEQILAQAA